ncbi:MAG: NAD-dependent deacylase [Bacteroidales bacterium]|nr:NAD-dependent deacylase [Bacteroidales bacterium]
MKRIVILSGAGVSAESGIRTFRDSDGLWEEYNVMEVASIDGWYKDSKTVLEFYNARRNQIKAAQPNNAHKIIAELEKHFEVSVITQNIDNLHERAGSSNVIHLHGEITKVRPENDENTIIDIGYDDVNIGDTDKNGIQLRPHIVWFGEAVPMMDKAIEEVKKGDILLIIGTSLNVYPAAGLVNYVKNGTPIYLIDPNPIRLNYKYFTQIQEQASSGMEKIRELLLK